MGVFGAGCAKTSVTPADGDNLVWSPTDSQNRLLALINGGQRSLDVEQLEFGDTALVNAIAAAAGRGVAGSRCAWSAWTRAATRAISRA